MNPAAILALLSDLTEQVHALQQENAQLRQQSAQKDDQTGQQQPPA